MSTMMISTSTKIFEVFVKSFKDRLDVHQASLLKAVLNIARNLLMGILGGVEKKIVRKFFSDIY